MTEDVEDQLNETQIARTIGRENIFLHTERIGESFNNAWDAAQKWLAEQPPADEPPAGDAPDVSMEGTVDS